jgi:hypothetical protein
MSNIYWHNILEPIVIDGILHSALETSLAGKIPVTWYSSNCYNSNIIIINFTL